MWRSDRGVDVGEYEIAIRRAPEALRGQRGVGQRVEQDGGERSASAERRGERVGVEVRVGSRGEHRAIGLASKGRAARADDRRRHQRHPHFRLVRKLRPHAFFPLDLRGGQRLFRRGELPPRGGARSFQNGELLLVLGGGHADERLGVAAIGVEHAGFLVRVEVGVELVKLALRDRVVFVIVAAGAAEREAEPRLAGGVHAVDDRLREPLRLDASALAIQPRVAVKTGRDFLRQRGVGQQIAGELLDGKLVERLIAVVGADDPVAPRPHEARAVALEAVAVRVAREVEPLLRHFLAVARRREQPVHHPIVGLGSGVGEKRGHFLRRRREPREVERHAADKRLA